MRMMQSATSSVTAILLLFKCTADGVIQYHTFSRIPLRNIMEITSTPAPGKLTPTAEDGSSSITMRSM